MFDSDDLPTVVLGILFVLSLVGLIFVLSHQDQYNREAYESCLQKDISKEICWPAVYGK